MIKMRKVMRLLCLLIAMTSMSISAYAISIVRYVSIGADGDGLSAENPTSNLGAVLNLAPKVDELKIYITPGIYEVPHAYFEGGYGFSNVSIFGVNNFRDMETPDQLPTIETNFLNINGATLVNIEIYGGLELRGSAYLHNVEVFGMINHIIDGYAEYGYVNSKGITLSGRGTGAQANLTLVTTKGSSQYGLKANDVQIFAEGCRFMNNRRGGARIEGGKQSTFSNCFFEENEEEGACVIQEFRDFFTTFINCEFTSNTTSDTRYYGGGVTSLASTLHFKNCIFIGNHSIEGPVGGAIKTGTKFSVQNCWFHNNDAAIYCDAYAGEMGYAKYPVENTVFTANAKELYSPNGYQIETQCCAMQQGSGIPEIDALNGTIAIHPDLDGSIEGVKYAGIYVTEDGRYALRENSALINAGCEVSLVKDIYGANRCIYGKTDIGPFEYVAPIVRDTPLKEVNVGGIPFYTATSTFNGVEYGFLTYREGPLILATGSELYYGRKTNGYKLFDLFAAVYTEEYGQKSCFIYQASNNYVRKATWFFKKAFPYSGNTKPVVKKLPGDTPKFSITIGTKTQTYIP